MTSESIEIQPLRGPVQFAIQPPGSKSLTNRALVCAALADGNSVLNGALDSDDTRVMREAMARLGISVAANEAQDQLNVTGCGGNWPQRRADLFVGNSGTTVRFLTAMLATAPQGEYRLDGVPRMRERPIGDLAAALRELGAEITCTGPQQCPPVTVVGRGLRGGTTHLAGDVSSQFLSGLLMAAPYADQDTEILLKTPLVSVPYVEMTLAVMQSFGAVASASDDYSRIEVSHADRYQGRSYAIEPDASAASYFFAIAAVAGGEATVTGLDRASLQGDLAFCDCLEQMGCEVVYSQHGTTVRGGRLRGVDLDMNAISDTVQTLAVVALFADGVTTIRNVGHIRHKETDRIDAVARELRKLGANVEEWDDALRITPGPSRGAIIDTYDDHRMAMSFAIAGLKIPGVIIRDPQCTQKTYPHFFRDLKRAVQA
jgi:3-phosphoshikimate 1-carboxyvinyltransferase